MLLAVLSEQTTIGRAQKRLVPTLPFIASGRRHRGRAVKAHVDSVDIVA